MPKLVVAGLALLAVLALAATVKAAMPVPPPPPDYDPAAKAFDRVEKMRQDEAAVWGRLDQVKSNWQQIVYERARRIVPEPPLPPISPIRPPPVQPLPIRNPFLLS